MKVLRLEELEIMKNIFENLSSITSTDLMCSVTDKSNFIFYKKGNGIDVKAVVEENLLIACWDSKSRGTKDMIDIAKRRKIPFEIIKY